MSRTSTIYVLHFEPAYEAPIGTTGRVKTAGHYIGSCSGAVADRVAQHTAGRGSPLVRAAIAAGCEVVLAATMPGGRDDERRVKQGHHHARYCPLCTERPAVRPPVPRAVYRGALT